MQYQYVCIGTEQPLPILSFDLQKLWRFNKNKKLQFDILKKNLSFTIDGHHTFGLTPIKSYETVPLKGLSLQIKHYFMI